MHVFEKSLALLDTAAIFDQDEPGAMQVQAHPGDKPEAREMLLLGENASGKSLFRQLLSGSYSGDYKKKKKDFEGIHISMATRAGGGMRSSFMYGPFTESEQSTGVRSMAPLTGAFTTASGRSHAVSLCLDEMELGLNACYHYALGQEIAAMHQEKTQGMDNFLGLILITHSKELVLGFCDQLGYRPHLLMCGTIKHQSLQDWLDAPLVRRSREDLAALRTDARERHRGFSQFFGGRD